MNALLLLLGGGGGNPWDLSNAAYSGKAFVTSAPYSRAVGVSFSPTGEKMHITTDTSDNTGGSVYQFTLSTPWDVDTASYDGVAFFLNQLTGVGGAYFGKNGERMYAADIFTRRIYQYNLSTPWDVSTASISGNSILSGPQRGPRQMAFNADGTAVYAPDFVSQQVYRIPLTTAWELTGSPTPVAVYEGGFQCFAFGRGGTKLFSSGANSVLSQYTLSTPYDLSTAIYDGVSFDSVSQEGNLRQVAFRPNGARMYLVGINTRNVFQYSLTRAG